MSPWKPDSKVDPDEVGIEAARRDRWARGRTRGECNLDEVQNAQRDQEEEEWPKPWWKRSTQQDPTSQGESQHDDVNEWIERDTHDRADNHHRQANAGDGAEGTATGSPGEPRNRRATNRYD